MEGKIEKFPINTWLFQGGIHLGDMYINNMMCFINPEEKYIQVGYTWTTDNDLEEIYLLRIFEKQSGMAYNILLPTFESIAKEVEKNIKELSPCFKRDETKLFHHFLKKEFESAYFKEYAHILEEKMNNDEEESKVLSPYTIGGTVDEQFSDMEFFNITTLACTFYSKDSFVNISYEYVLKDSDDKEKHTKTFRVFYRSKNSEISAYYNFFKAALKVGLRGSYVMCAESVSVDDSMNLIEKEFERSFSAVYDLIQTAKTL